MRRSPETQVLGSVMTLGKRLRKSAGRLVGRLPGGSHLRRIITADGPSVVGLERLPELVANEYEVFPQQELEFRHPQATPVPVYFHQDVRRIVVLQDVLVWPETSLVLTGQGELIEESAFSSYRARRLFDEGKRLSRKPRRIPGPCAVIEQGTMDNHYHWLIDILPRLYALHHPEMEALGEVTLLLTERMDEGRRQIIDRLVPANVRIESVLSETTVQADRYIHLPYLSGEWAGYLPEEYLSFFRERVAGSEFGSKRGSLTSKRRLLVSRADAQVRRLVDESDVSALLSKLGFEVYVPGRHTFEEQAEAFRNAELIVGMHGAGLTNMLFASDAKVVEILPSNYPGLNHFRLLAAALGHEYVNLACGKIFRPDELQVPWRLRYGESIHNADVRVDPPRVLEALRKLGV